MQIQVFLDEKAPRISSEQFRVALSIIRGMRERGIFTLLALVPNSYSLAGKKHTTLWLDKRAENRFNYLCKWIRNVSKQALIRAIILFYIHTKGKSANAEAVWRTAYEWLKEEVLAKFRQKKYGFTAYGLTTPFLATPVYGIGKNKIIIPFRYADPELDRTVNPFNEGAMYWIGHYPWIHRLQLFGLVVIKGKKLKIYIIPGKFLYMRLVDYSECKLLSKALCEKLKFNNPLLLNADKFRFAQQTFVKLLSRKTIIKRGETALLLLQAWYPDPKSWLRYELHLLREYARTVAFNWSKWTLVPNSLLFGAEFPTDIAEKLYNNKRYRDMFINYVNMYLKKLMKQKERIVISDELPKRLLRKIIVKEKKKKKEKTVQQIVNIDWNEFDKIVKELQDRAKKILEDRKKKKR